MKEMSQYAPGEYGIWLHKLCCSIPQPKNDLDRAIITAGIYTKFTNHTFEYVTFGLVFNLGSVFVRPLGLILVDLTFECLYTYISMSPYT